MFTFEPPDHSTSVSMSALSARLLGKAFGIPGHEISVHFSKGADIPFSFAVTFWVNGRRTSTIITIHDILLTKLQSFFHLFLSPIRWFDYHPHLSRSETPMDLDTTNTISCTALHKIDLAQSQSASRPDGSAGAEVEQCFCTTCHKSQS
jgi:hypothetical protein